MIEPMFLSLSFFNSIHNSYMGAGHSTYKTWGLRLHHYDSNLALALDEMIPDWSMETGQ